MTVNYQSLKLQWIIFWMFQGFQLNVNVEALPAKIPEVFGEIKNLFDRRFFEGGILLKRNKKLAIVGQKPKAVLLNAGDLAIYRRVTLRNVCAIHG
jgi:hypothetical protein